MSEDFEPFKLQYFINIKHLNNPLMPAQQKKMTKNANSQTYNYKQLNFSSSLLK